MLQLNQLLLLAQILPKDRLDAAEELVQALATDRVVTHRPLLLYADETSFPKDRKVFGYGGLIGADEVGQLANAKVSSGQRIENQQSRRMGECSGNSGSGFVLLH